MATSLTSTGVQFPNNSIQLASASTMFRNRIINGDMRIAQRGTSFTTLAIGTTYTIDRFKFQSNTTAVLTVTQNTDVPVNSKIPYSFRATVSTADTSVASTDYAMIVHNIEGYNSIDLFGQPFTISFWVKSSISGTYCINLTNGVDFSYITEYTITSINTWEQKIIIIPSGLPLTGGTWNKTNGNGLRLAWMLMTGSNYYAITNTWIPGDVAATANQVNGVNTVGNIFAITGVQLEKGNIATTFEVRPIQFELAMCQRYYQTYYTVVEVNVNFSTFVFSVPMRVAPTIAGGGAGFIINVSSATAYNAYQSTRAYQTLTFNADL